MEYLEVKVYTTTKGIDPVSGVFLAAGVEGIVMKHKHQKRVFVQLQGVGIFATAYIPSAFLKRKIEN